MARPSEPELTQRELDVMHVFWGRTEELTPSEVRERLGQAGTELAYPTVANLVRGLCEKGLLEQTCRERPYRYRPRRSFDEVAGRLVRDMIDRVFRGSRELLLRRLVDGTRLTAKERRMLEELLQDKE